MKAALLQIGRLWLDSLLWLIVLTLVFFIYNAIRGLHSVAVLLGLAAALFPYALAGAAQFAFPRATRASPNRPAGYLTLFAGFHLALIAYVLILPLAPRPVDAPATSRALPTGVVAPLPEGELYVSSVRGDRAEGIFLFDPSSKDAPLARFADAPLGADRASVVAGGKTRTPFVPPPEPRPPVVDALDFAGVREFMFSFAGKNPGERIMFALSLALALMSLWPLSRTGSWPMVSFCVSFAAAVGFFALLSLVASGAPERLVGYLELKIPATWTHFLASCVMVLVLGLFDLVFLRNPRERR